MTDYLITGGAGFIGSNIAEHLVTRGKSVRVFDNFSSGRKENVAPFAGRAEVITGDLCDFKAVSQAMPRSCGTILHLGAIPGVRVRWRNRN